MSQFAAAKAAPDKVVLSVLTHLKKGKIDDAIACFAEGFTFKDFGIGLEFKCKAGLAEFFKKRRELCPGSCLKIDSILMSVDREVSEWTLRTTITESVSRGLSRKAQVVLQGVSVVRTKNGKITDWSDYYTGRTSQRMALASHFADRVES
jgi:hypothetical protein